MHAHYCLPCTITPILPHPATVQRAFPLSLSTLQADGNGASRRNNSFDTSSTGTTDEDVSDMSPSPSPSPNDDASNGGGDGNGNGNGNGNGSGDGNGNGNGDGSGSGSGSGKGKGKGKRRRNDDDNDNDDEYVDDDGSDGRVVSSYSILGERGRTVGHAVVTQETAVCADIVHVPISSSVIEGYCALVSVLLLRVRACRHPVSL